MKRSLAALVVAGVLGASLGAVVGGSGDDGAMPFKPRITKSES